jgi:hypothetical protein
VQPIALQQRSREGRATARLSLRTLCGKRMIDTRLPNHEGVLVASYDELSFSNDAIVMFGAQIPELIEEAGSIHTQVGTLGGYILESKDSLLANKIFQFLDKVLTDPKSVSEIENAVAISFLSASELRKSIAGVVYWGSIPEKLRNVLVAQEKLDNAT